MSPSATLEAAKAIPEDVLQAAKSVLKAIREQGWEGAGVVILLSDFILAEREKAATLAETVDLPKTVRLAHMQLAVKIAARAIRRGRHLTAEEKLANFQNWLLTEEDA